MATSQNAPLGLKGIVDLVGADPGLRARIPGSDIGGGQEGARRMNTVFEEAMRATGVNADGILSPTDVQRMSDYIRSKPALYAQFVEGHGDDEGRVETGYHLVQNDGATLTFQGRNFVNTVADAIYHVGFRYSGDRFVNEDGARNERIADVAGWMNYFVNGVTVLYGTDASETLNSSSYSPELADAASELFLAGGGNDRIWMKEGDDTLHAGSGNDLATGGTGDDVMQGEAGNDSLYGEAGDDLIEGSDGFDRLFGDDGDDMILGGDHNDFLAGGAGMDTLEGGTGNDTMVGGNDADEMSGESGNDVIWGQFGDDSISGGDGSDMMGGQDGNDSIVGEAGNDTLYGDRGDDTLEGGDGNDHIEGFEGDDLVDGGAGDDFILGEAGNDTIHGGDGNDRLFSWNGDDVLDGGAGNDQLKGGDGVDIYIGGAGADRLEDWAESRDARDIFVFAPGDTGVTAGTRDTVFEFTSGVDRIDLTAFDDLDFTTDPFAGDGSGEVRFADWMVEIDADGNGSTDAMIELRYVRSVVEGDFIL